MSDQTPAVSDTQPIRKPNIPKDAAVLVVEDNVSNFVLIARMLGTWESIANGKHQVMKLWNMQIPSPVSILSLWISACRMKMAMAH
jgi:hypothetical protein